MRAKAQVFVVDDDEAIRDALTLLLETEGYAVEAFGSAAEFLASCPERCSGCVILDIRMPEMSGLELQATLTRRGAGLSVVMLTSHGDVATAVTALKAGAVDFIEKPFDVPALLAAVAEAVSRDHRRRRHDLAQAEVEGRLRTLTLREREVMELVAAGDPNKVVATKLGISVRTAEVHRAKVMEKMQVANLSALIHMLLRHREDDA